MQPMKMAIKFTVLVIHFYIFGACEMYTFKAVNDVQLKNHVITTMTTPYVEICWDKCVWIMNCFSINVRVNSFGTFECDLNNSTKKASPESMVSRQGSQYYRMKGVHMPTCSLYNCRRKDALADDWYRINKVQIRMFLVNRNWTKARNHCQSLGGDLLSISTAYESDFVDEVKKMALRNSQVQNQSPWIGLNSLSTSRYKWSDGSRTDFMALNSSTPSLSTMCVAFGNNRKWFPRHCNRKSTYFCKRPMP